MKYLPSQANAHLFLVVVFNSIQQFIMCTSDDFTTILYISYFSTMIQILVGIGYVKWMKYEQRHPPETIVQATV